MKDLVTELGVMRMGVQILLTDKFTQVLIESERDAPLRANLVAVIADSLGKTTDIATYPKQWARLLERKDCPQYMKELTTLRLEEYYPKLALPEEEKWLTFRNGEATFSTASEPLRET